MNEESKTFVIYITVLEILPGLAGMTMHLSHTALIAGLKQDKASTKVLPKYLDHIDIFCFDLAIELLENTRINGHPIKLQQGKQPPYGLIYSLEPVELETLKTYIETHLKTGFIQPSKSLTSAPILFNKKLDNNLCLYINY